MALVKMDQLSESFRARTTCAALARYETGITVMKWNGHIIPKNHSPGILMHGGLESMIKRREEV